MWVGESEQTKGGGKGEYVEGIVWRSVMSEW